MNKYEDNIVVNIYTRRADKDQTDIAKQKFKKIAAKSMNVPSGSNFIVQEVLMLEQTEDRDRVLIGCFIDKE